MSPSIFLGLALATFTEVAHAGGPSPFALPAKGWAGIDGNWSTVEFDLGSSSQAVNVVMGTALSEFWAVDVGGCYPKEPQCSSARAGLYDPGNSKDWQALGTWQLGLPYLGYGGAGQYGLDSIKTTSDVQEDDQFAMSDVLMAAINTTDYFMGQFGLGITQGEFAKGVTAKSPLISAVQDAGLIPSYSYGYTAGAHYNDMPASVTLGGYDTARFEDHDDEFTINKADNYLHAKVRGIEVKAEKDTPSSWDSSIQTLSNYDDKFNAVVDSSTPFLWFPDSVCDSFAKALDLDYDKDLDLYTLTDDQYRSFREPDAYTFTFSLSSADNSDNFGDPLNTQGVVNITIPIEALVSTVEYPFNNQAIKYGAPAKAYFSLRRRGNNETMVIGRSFLQESYLVTEYDRGVWSIHQAKFPKDPIGDAKIEAISQPAGSGYPPPAKHSSHGALGRGEIAGIVVGASVAVMIIVLGWWFWRRRRNAARAAARPSTSADSEMEKRSAGSVNDAGSMKPASPLNRIFAKIVRKKQSSAATSPEDQPPTEVPNHEIFEMPVPDRPVELNGDTGDEMGDSDVSLGLDNQYMSSYEQARWRMDRQLAGPVPAYSPPAHGIPVPYEKAPVYDHEQPRAVPIEEQARQVPGEQPKPVPTVAVETIAPAPPIQFEGFTPTQPAPPALPPAPTSDNSSSLQGSMGSVVSPISPTGGTMRWDEPSPVAAAAPQLPHSQSLRQQPRSNPNLNASERARSTSPQADQPGPGSSTQRKPVIDPSKVVCLGPLPETYRLSTQSFLPAILGPDGEKVSPPSAPSSRDPYEDTLGTNFTEEEDRVAEMARKASQYELREEQKRLAWEQGTMLPSQIEALHRQQQAQKAQGSHGSQSSEPSKTSVPAVEPDSPASNERLDGLEFIHIPQPAAKRFSWEEDR